jgi:hypothetical protein
MSRKVQRVTYRLDSHGIDDLPLEEIKAILRGADDLIMSGGRTLLTQLLKGSHTKKLLELGLDQNELSQRQEPGSDLAVAGEG